MRIFNRHPIVVCGVILAGAVWGFVSAHGFVVNVLQPRERAARQARITQKLDEADTKLKHHQWDRALSTYRFLLTAREADLSASLKGRLHHDSGLCLMGLAARKNEKDNLESAISSFQAALTFRPREGDPQGFSESQIRLGQAYVRLGQSLDEPADFEKGVAAFHEALRVRTREADPEGYAGLQILIGNARRDAFVSGPAQGDARMDPALEAYKAALAATSPEADPLVFGQTHLEIGRAYLKLADGVYKRSNTRKALKEFEEALEIFDRKSYPTQFGRTQKLIGDTYDKMYNEVEVSRDSAWRERQARYQWQRQARHAYDLAAQFGAGRFAPVSSSIDK